VVEDTDWSVVYSRCKRCTSGTDAVQEADRGLPAPAVVEGAKIYG